MFNKAETRFKLAMQSSERLFALALEAERNGHAAKALSLLEQAIDVEAKAFDV